MQRRILGVVVLAVVLAVTVLGTPLTFVLRQYLHAQERGELVGAAVSISVTVPRNLRETGGKPQLGAVPENMHVAIYDGDAHLLTGEGPPNGDEIVRHTLDGTPSDGFAGQDLVAAVPVMRGESVVAVVRASSPREVLVDRERTVVLGVGAVALLAALTAALLGLWLARRLTKPLRSLQSAAVDLGEGDFTVRAPTSGVRELDAVAESLNATAGRLGQLLERERAFASHASHQLRTPLTALRLQLDGAVGAPPEQSAAATARALAIVDDLESTVSDLLAVSRGRTADVAALDLDGLLSGLSHRWSALLAAEGRSLRIAVDDPPVGRGRTATLRQVLDVLIDNAYRHGGGPVEVTARDASGALAIDVVDAGRPGGEDAARAEFARISAGARPDGRPAPDASVPRPSAPPPAGRRAGPRARAGTRRGGTGIGLGLARSLVVADGGRLLLTAVPGRTCATILLPAHDGTEAAPAASPPPATLPAPAPAPAPAGQTTAFPGIVPTAPLPAGSPEPTEIIGVPPPEPGRPTAPSPYATPHPEDELRPPFGGGRVWP